MHAVAIPGCATPGRMFCRPAPGSLRSISARSSTRSTRRCRSSPIGADRLRCQPARREERHRDRAGDHRDCPDPRRRRDRWLDQRQPAPDPADRRQSPATGIRPASAPAALDAGVSPGHAWSTGGHRAEGQGPLQRLKPSGDAQFADYVTHPTLPALLEIALNLPKTAPTNLPRTDLVATFLTGIRA